MMQGGFWVWALYALTGVIVISILPQNARGWAIAVIVLGALAYAYKKDPNVYTNIGKVIKGQSYG